MPSTLPARPNMPLTEKLLQKKLRRPRNVRDFDRRPGLPYLVHRETTRDESVWTSSWWLNISCLLVAALLAGILCIPFLVSDSFLADVLAMPLPKRVPVLLAGLVVAVIILCLVLGAINRSRFVIDFARVELRFRYSIWRWKEYTIPFADIRAVKSRLVENVAGIDDGPPVSHRVVFVELHNGELVLIATDADFRQESLYRQIEQALDAYPFVDARPDRPLLLA